MSSLFTIILCVGVFFISGFTLCSAQNDKQNEENLREAAKNGNEKLIEELLRSGINVNAPEASDQSTALHYAAEYGSERIAQILLDNGANVNAETKFRDTPLIMAVKNGYEKVVEILLRNGARVNAEDEDKWTPLHFAARNGTKKITEDLLKNDASINAENDFEDTPLHVAAHNGNLEVIRSLLEKRAPINAVNKDEATPLHLAIQNGHFNVSKLLLRNGANANAEDARKKTPLYRAVENGKENLIELLLRNGAYVDAESKFKLTPLHRATQLGNEKVVQLLLRKGAEVNAQDENQKTPLHDAARLGYAKIVEILIQNGANKNARDKDRLTPLHEAVQNGHENIVVVLLRHGALRDAKTNNMETPLDIANGKGNEKIIQILRNSSRPSVEACQKYRNLPISFILGGSPTESGEFPWMAALGYFESRFGYGITFNCGGTIISDRYILTAAHCVKPSNAPIVARLGKLTLMDTDDDKAINYKITEIIRHANYSTLTSKNDIALIRLEEKIDFTDFISPACLQTDLRDEETGVKMVVSGWGKTSAEGTERSNVLLKAQVETLPLQECNSSYVLYNEFHNLPAFRGGLSEGQYCAFDPQGKNDSCQGDSGGPLQFFNGSNEGIATVVGIVSFGIDCGSGLPGIYTRVAYFLDWIESIVWP